MAAGPGAEGGENSVDISAPAKVNLFLRVLAREEGGYHRVETLYAALDFRDELTVERADSGVELTVEGADLGPPGENLAHRAARAFLDRVGGGGARITLRKAIPPRAGLGGGSSDAAAVLRALSRLYGDPLERRELVSLGAGLGADVPFFLSPTPLALGWGRGDRLLSLPPLPSRPVILVLPDEGVETAGAYARLAEARGAGSDGPAEHAGGTLLSPEELESWEGVAALAANDFHATVFADRAELARLHEILLGTKPLLTLLAGSGAALFAAYPGRDEADAGRDAASSWAEAEGGRVIVTRTLDALPAMEERG